MLSHNTYSYNYSAIRIDFSQTPVGFQSRCYLKSNHSHHARCSLRNQNTESQWYEREVQGNTTQHGRANPRNPRLQMEISTLKEFTKDLENKVQAYAESSKPSALFSVEERSLLNNSKPNLEKVFCEKWPLLHTLAISGDSFALDRLLRQNIDVNLLDKDGYSALQRAVLARKETIVNQLLRAEADFFIRDKGGATLLHFSVQTGSMSMVKSFLHCGIDVNSSDQHGWTPLHLAVLSGRADIVRLLLISGADKTLKTKDGLTPLELCFSLGRGFNSIEVAKSLKKFPTKERSYTVGSE